MAGFEILLYCSCYSCTLARSTSTLSFDRYSKWHISFTPTYDRKKKEQLKACNGQSG